MPENVYVLDKRIRDFPILEEAQDDDVLLASTETETYALRVRAFNERYAAGEQARVDAEAKRAAAEQERAAAETKRGTAEQARADAETKRASAEADRATAEKARADAEAKRAAAETKREEDTAAAIQGAEEATAEAQEAADHPPVPNTETGNWDTWDGKNDEYKDTGAPYQGNIMYAAFWLDATTGDLYMYTDTAYNGPDFRLNGNDLEVWINAG